MITINLQNVEELIFYNKAAQQVLPEFRNIFQTWGLGKRVSALKNLSQKALFDFFEELKEEHIHRLEQFFGTAIKVVTTDPHLVKHYSFTLDEAEDAMNELALDGNFFVWRDCSRVYISFWR